MTLVIFPLNFFDSFTFLFPIPGIRPLPLLPSSTPPRWQVSLRFPAQHLADQRRRVFPGALPEGEVECEPVVVVVVVFYGGSDRPLEALGACLRDVEVNRRKCGWAGTRGFASIDRRTTSLRYAPVTVTTASGSLGAAVTVAAAALRCPSKSHSPSASSICL